MNPFASAEAAMWHPVSAVGCTLLVTNYVVHLRIRPLKGGGNAPFVTHSSYVQKDGVGPFRQFPPRYRLQRGLQMLF